MAEVDDDQLVALRRLRLRAAFGPIEVVEVISHDQDNDQAGPLDELIEDTAMADPRRMPPQEQEQAMRS